MFRAFLIVALMGILTTHANAETSTLTVEVTNIQKVKGTVYAALYNSKEGYDAQEGMEGAMAAVEGETVVLTFNDLTPGFYAIQLFQDLDGDGAITLSWSGAPKEPYGFSNNARGFMSPPKWKDASFEIGLADIKQNITIER